MCNRVNHLYFNGKRAISVQHSALPRRTFGPGPFGSLELENPAAVSRPRRLAPLVSWSCRARLPQAVIGVPVLHELAVKTSSFFLFGCSGDYRRNRRRPARLTLLTRPRSPHSPRQFDSPTFSGLQTVGCSSKLRTVAIRGGPITMAKSHLKLVAPTEVNRTVTPTRRPNAELRTREHLTPGRSRS